MNIWIVNPFDELPGDTDLRHRYWALAETLARPEPVEGTQMSHSVTWWSSNCSHRHKAFRPLGAKADGQRTHNIARHLKVLRPLSFDLRLIKTSPYTRNVSFARLRNHHQFAQRFLTEARALIAAHPQQAPDRIVVSLPPLGTAEAAFALRNDLGGPSNCQVVVDIMDAWPETFYRAFRLKHVRRRAFAALREKCISTILSPLHRAARRAYTRADRISAVSQIYIDLAKARRKTNYQSQRSEDTFHLCYHGIDFDD